MKKKNLIVFLLSFFLIGCSIPNPLCHLPDPETIQKDGVNIKDFDFINIPKNGINRGYFDDYNIKLVITYDDKAQSQNIIDLTMKKIPREYRVYLNTIGEHTVSIYFRGITKDFTFKILDSDREYTITYLNYNGAETVKILQCDSDYVIKAEDVPTAPEREEDSRFIYSNKHWEDDLVGKVVGVDVIDDMDVYPQYDPIFKRSHCVSSYPKKLTSGQIILKDDMGKDILVDDFANRILYYEHQTDNVYDAYYHIAREQRVPLLVGDSVVDFETGSPEATLNASFTPDPSTYSDIAKNIYSSFVDWNTIGELAYFTGDSGNNGDPETYTYTASDTTSIKDRLHDNITTRFVDGGPYYQIYGTYLSDILDEFSGNYTAKISSSSPTGRYRLVLQGDVDVIMKMRIEDVSTSEDYKQIRLVGVELIMTLDETTVAPVLDYVVSGDFNCTKETATSNKDIFDNAACAMFGEYHE